MKPVHAETVEKAAEAEEAEEEVEVEEEEVMVVDDVIKGKSC
jgi:pyrimidine operon attenuation protein/uracil phosphoribosyltransferase